MKSIFSNIQQYYDELSSTEQLTIDFILNYNDLNNIKLNTIQSSLHISSSTIIRAVKKLGFDSFTEFKYTLLNSQQNLSKFTENKSFENVILNISEDFERTIELMEQKKILNIVDTILNSRRIFCIGLGSSSSVADSFNHKLNNYGLWSSDYSENFPLRDIENVAKKEDTIMIFSLSGAEKEIVEAATACKVKGCTIISVTGLSSNPLANISNTHLMTHQSTAGRSKLRSRLMLSVASEIIFETILSNSKPNIRHL